MHTKASICNGALGMLGRDPLVLDADAAQEYGDADAAVRAYDERIGRVLRSHPWNFAMVRAQLTADAVKPLFGYANRFALPTVPPCARVWSIGDENLTNSAAGRNDKYSVEGGYILTDDGGPLNLRYIARILDPSLFDDEFAEALMSAIAFKIAPKVLGSVDAADWFRKVAREDAAEARTVDGQENPQQAIEEGGFLIGRRTG